MSDSGRTLGQTCGHCGETHPEGDLVTCRMNLAAEVEQLKHDLVQSRASFAVWSRTDAGVAQTKVTELTVEGWKKQSEILALREALRPFAAVGEEFRDGWEDSQPLGSGMFYNLTLGDFRRAFVTLNSSH